MSIWERVKHIFAENQIMVVLIGIIAGILLPKYFKPIAPYGTYLLMLIFFTSSLRLNLKELMGYAKDWKMMAMATAFMLVFLPLAMWLPPAVFSPDWALAFLIMGAMPTGMTIALIADLFGGKTSLALVVTAATSLLAPITIPVVFWLAIGQMVPVPVFTLFGNLFITIVIPFILAALFQRKAPKIVKKYDPIWRNVAVWTFGVLIAAIVGDTTGQGPIILSGRDIGLIIVMLIYIGGLTALAFLMAWWRSNAEKATLALCMVYLNNTLALYIANRYFPSSRLMTQLVIILLVINVLLPPFRWIAAYAVHLDKLKTKKRIKRTV
ncbi:MAG: bile acid:sodium symporter [Patescibacteria group bacterium]|nr:bile acid:sodium symporter [Patescibacteria group bacterium]